VLVPFYVDEVRKSAIVDVPGESQAKFKKTRTHVSVPGRDAVHRLGDPLHASLGVRDLAQRGEDVTLGQHPVPPRPLDRRDLFWREISLCQSVRDEVEIEIERV